MRYKDYYKIMGLSRDASQDDVRRAYRRLARKYHPDVSKEADAEERFKELGEAYEVLKDKEKRAAYDDLGSGYRPGEEVRPPPNWSENVDFGGAEFGENVDLGDFFESLFGGARRRGGAGFSSRGEDLQTRVAITLEEAYAGSTQSISLRTPEVTPEGVVRTRERTLQVKVPAGVTEGQLIRLAGQGSPGTGDAPAGDVFLEVMIAPHPHFSVDGKDVFLELPVAPWEAALGARISVPTLGGNVTLKVPAGAQTGTKLRLKGRGLPGNRPGDQYVTLKIVTPKAETPQAKELYENMAKQFEFNPRSSLAT